MLILDHAFHRKTRSFDFLFAILGGAFNTTIEYVEPTAPDIAHLLSFEQDYIVICQLDFLAPLFINLGRRVVVIQMFDGSAGLPDTYWDYNRQATYLNFSLAMHLRALRAGCRSMLLKYFVNPEEYRPIQEFSKKRLFFWQRLPQSRINVEFVGYLLGAAVDSVHLHLPTDDASRPDRAAAAFPCEVTTSDWFESRDDFNRILDTCNIFVAPRMAEGIGQIMLEAMARGMVVLAYDLPTHNEYIANWYNGILFDLSSEPVQINNWPIRGRQIGARARMTVEQGHINWLRQAAAIPTFVTDTPPAVAPPGRFFQDFARKTVRAYSEGQEAYAKALENQLAVQATGRWHDTIVPAEMDEISADALRSATFMCGAVSSGIKLCSGWSEPEGGHVWATAHSAILTIDMPIDRRGPFRILVEARSLAAKLVTLHVNGDPPVDISLAPLFDHHLLPGSFTVRSDPLTIEFTVDTLERTLGDPREFAFALRSIRFESIAAQSLLLTKR